MQNVTYNSTKDTIMLQPVYVGKTPLLLWNLTVWLLWGDE